MKLQMFKRKDEAEESYYLKRKKRLARAKTRSKYAKIVIFLLIIPAITIFYHAESLKIAQDELIWSISHNDTLKALQERSEAKRDKEEILNRYDDILQKMGSMGEHIKKAGIEFGDNEEEAVKIIGLSIGIANAESSLGTKFVYDYDYNCYNWWGIKPPSGRRADGSYLRCLYNEEAGARTFASLIKRLYLNEGLDTPEKIANKWVGANQSTYHQQWIANVNKYYKQ